MPEGEWFDWTNKETVHGNKVFEKGYTISQIPVFLKSGTIVPMYPNFRNMESIPDTLILAVMPGSKGRMEFYDDNGKDKAYQAGGYAIIHATQETKSGITTIDIDKQIGAYPSPVKVYRIDLYNVSKAVKAFSNGKNLRCDHEPETKMAHLFLNRAFPYAKQTVNIR